LGFWFCHGWNLICLPSDRGSQGSVNGDVSLVLFLGLKSANVRQKYLYKFWCSDVAVLIMNKQGRLVGKARTRKTQAGVGRRFRRLGSFYSDIIADPSQHSTSNLLPQHNQTTLNSSISPVTNHPDIHLYSLHLPQNKYSDQLRNHGIINRRPARVLHLRPQQLRHHPHPL
jgi:hypothetical protein